MGLFHVVSGIPSKRLLYAWSPVLVQMLLFKAKSGADTVADANHKVATLGPPLIAHAVD